MTDDLDLDLVNRPRHRDISFGVNAENELLIQVGDSIEGAMLTVLNREEGQMLADLLKRWLS